MSLTTHTRRQISYAEGYLALGMKAEAAQALAEITGEDVGAVPVLALSLIVHTELKAWVVAASLSAALCEREPHEAAYWVQWAYATRRFVNIEAARAILVKALGLHPLVAVIHFNLACYEAQLGNLDDARSFLETACGLDTECVELAKTDEDLEPLRA